MSSASTGVTAGDLLAEDQRIATRRSVRVLLVLLALVAGAWLIPDARGYFLGASAAYLWARWPLRQSGLIVGSPIARINGRGALELSVPFAISANQATSWDLTWPKEGEAREQYQPGDLGGLDLLRHPSFRPE